MLIRSELNRAIEFQALRREAEKNGGVIPTADPYHDQKNGKSPRAARR